jgi:F-type H+-transporting ATPase subunit delta
MKNYLIAERYARGLSESIPEDAQLEEATQSLEALSMLYTESHDLRSVLSNPSIDVHRRVAVLRQVFEHASTPSVVLRLAELMLRRGRISLLAAVSELFGELADTRLNRITADVFSAAPLDDAQQERVRAGLRKHTDKEVRLDCRVDKELLGGVKARLGDRVFDGSLRARLKNMKKVLLTEG